MTVSIKNEITLLILVDGMAAGGTERQIIELLKGLKQEKSIKTVWGVLVKGGELQSEAEAIADVILPIRQKNQYDFSLAFSLIRLSKKYKIDIIHTFGSVSDFSGVIAGKVNSIPVINGSIRSARPKLSLRDWASRFCLYFADWIVANSYAGKKAFGMEHKKNISIIHNGVDLSRFKNVLPAKVKFPTICMVGNFTHKKNQSTLIELLPKLHIKYPTLRLTLVGRGERLPDLKQLAAALGLQEYVNFVTDCNNPESIIKACEIGILLSPQGEGLSNVIIEYMALEKPVIASDLGGNCELVEHGTTGYLVSDEHFENLVTCIDYLLSNHEVAVKMGQAGCERIKNGFNLEQMVFKYATLYKQLSGTKR